MNIEDMSIDEILEHLGLTTPTDFLNEVTAGDAYEHFGNDLLDYFSLTDHWDASDAVDRYGSELFEYIDPTDYGYGHVENWGAMDHIEYYGDDNYLFSVLVAHGMDARDIFEGITDNLTDNTIKRLLEIFKEGGYIKSTTLTGVNALLKAQRELLMERL